MKLSIIYSYLKIFNLCYCLALVFLPHYSVQTAYAENQDLIWVNIYLFDEFFNAILICPSILILLTLPYIKNSFIKWSCIVIGLLLTTYISLICINLFFGFNLDIEPHIGSALLILMLPLYIINLYFSFSKKPM